MHTVIGVLLGWNQSVGAPKRGGGIFGVVRAFGAAAETQRAGDLHTHFAVWLHGFPTTACLFDESLRNKDDFKKQLINLVDTVLVTKPPCICEENKCHVYDTANSLQPVLHGIDAFRRSAPGATPPITAKCIN
ncbi:unnamed protein product [Phytophthora fragariaefolia]|uniref:Unnamed protein product n=1 Tax=Phytophthora fragariaefolia TaxID=1490495 RepID=A0A9W6YC30_9STRA|nr:unnamed protein product [Phytophthora fragariaefolia]